MNELIEALEKLLERGIVVEPVVPDYYTTSPRSYRIRLANSTDEPKQERSTYARSW